LLTVDEAAEHLRVSRWTVYNLITLAALSECVESLGEVA
jgi:predicted DNA-binding protein (UPF0251 family)